MSASASAVFEGDDLPDPVGGEDWYVSGTVTYTNACCSSGTVSGSSMVIVDFMDEDTPGALRSGWGNGNGATLFNTCNSCCAVGGTYDTNYAMVPIEGADSITLVGSNSSVITERFNATTGLRDTTYGPLKSGGGANEHQGWAAGPSGTGYAAVLDVSAGSKVVVTGTSGANDFLAARFNNDGNLDSNFGQSGVIRIDFGSTSGVTTDGARAVLMRPLGSGVWDIIVAGYTFDSATSKYKIALVDLLDDHYFHVT